MKTTRLVLSRQAMSAPQFDWYRLRQFTSLDDCEQWLEKRLGTHQLTSTYDLLLKGEQRDAHENQG